MLYGKPHLQRLFEGICCDTPLGKREVVQATNSVGMLIYDATNKRVLLVKQSRAPMITDLNPNGEIVEVAAGRFDKKIGIKQLVVDEVLEELGATITEDDVEILNGG